ncbi:TnsA-like heteromeric transposase endonuclease subunit [Mycobacteroides abscessus]|uniref:TnsA-like heteromeric transposase endonuclease subunit n=1 Tax=Mycobacteroides abscessus TaxID=36809 RepID=UPI00030B1469|nr:TnsA-like heteromeric transposase endonuclease subunit [Mycobacteroides abscessus]MDM2050787.1 TnsA-like heteromeric transposase endonuclease subunit [Mycobacteroides abscessus]MDM2055347.1 TnsA-like heteromeric transposase endonuclease subunit [Mycobacteroides abscessus]MDM2059993.1 TnsA-like heteromeric transposase endonuclease subunit [Mycobacteroides abscessus]MDM2064602.1 TnsA-like heteromeric transposase endonuclease subunit [Mycobacteroides abscessus]MDM2069181.1 TnsA-like heteromeri
MTRVLACVDGSVQNLQVSSDVGSVQLEHTTPIREFFSWPGKRNYEGLYWSSTNRRHVEFESLLEREYLLAADNASDIVAIAAQPLALLWPRDTRGNRDHVADFFVRLANGDGRLVDVRSAKGAEKHAEQSALTRRVCDEIGWDYEVFTGLHPELAHNLRWLAGYRHDRSAPPTEVAESIEHCFAAPLPLQLGLDEASSRTGQSIELTTAHVLHLIWRRTLSTDMTRPLSMSSEVWA